MAFFKSGMILVFQHYITFFQLTIFKHTFLLGVLCVYYHADKNLQYVIIAAQQYSNYNFHFLISGELLFWSRLDFSERVTKIENIKTDSTKILRPTRFLGPKDIKTGRLFFGLILWIFFFQIRLVGLNIYLLLILENKTEALKTDNRVLL